MVLHENKETSTILKFKNLYRGLRPENCKSKLLFFFSLGSVIPADFWFLALTPVFKFILYSRFCSPFEDYTFEDCVLLNFYCFSHDGKAISWFTHAILYWRFGLSVISSLLISVSLGHWWPHYFRPKVKVSIFTKMLW